LLEYIDNSIERTFRNTRSKIKSRRVAALAREVDRERRSRFAVLIAHFIYRTQWTRNASTPRRMASRFI